MKKFKCASCGKVYAASRLGDSSLDEAGTTNPSLAIDLLRYDQLLCQNCDNDEDSVPAWGLEWRSDYYEYEGLDARDKARWDAIRMNY